MGSHHPESPRRLAAINAMVRERDWDSQLRTAAAPKLNSAHLATVHPKHHVEALLALTPTEGLVAVDGDTLINPFSVAASLHAAGAALEATDRVVDGTVDNAFCAVRPPGHHAESIAAMGFCLFNSIALAADYAIAQGFGRVAILDFDVHHGNGTVEIFQHRPEVLVCSSFQYPFYPGRHDRVRRPNICLTPLPAGTDSSAFRTAVERDWSAALQRHRPEMIFISAGFDAHRQDPFGGLHLEDDDFSWVTRFIRDQAQRYAGGRIVSLLEGGYHIDALTRSVAAHLEALAN
ncbi:histone deacetylase family protein [Exilibacterium tricleocarpae]|uniref:Histone deacetylase family protein n=2 Tax=Exilibacterium tricleocarpae TaxID=2591008 RepID=A0A545T6D9_9GAMM|nr:histone deacetylase family protein [Exilibacterium tricleocarpae]